MKEPEQTTDRAMLAKVGKRLARYRLTQNLTQTELAHEAGVSIRTLIRLEQGESTQLTNLLRVLRALGLLSNIDALVPDPGLSPLMRVATKHHERRRASRTPSGGGKPPKPWVWGEDERKPGGNA